MNFTQIQDAFLVVVANNTVGLLWPVGEAASDESDVPHVLLRGLPCNPFPSDI